MAAIVINKRPSVTVSTDRALYPKEIHKFAVVDCNTLELIGFSIEDGNTLVLD